MSALVKRLYGFTSLPANGLAVTLAICTSLSAAVFVFAVYLMPGGSISGNGALLLSGFAVAAIAALGWSFSFRAARRTAARLKLAEERVSLALSTAQLGVWDLDLKTGNATFIGEFFDRFRRPQSETMPFAEWMTNVHKDDREAVRAVLQAAIDEKSAYLDEYRVVRPSDGAVRWVAAYGRVICDRSGRAARIGGINQDITQRKSYEEHLQLAMRELSHRSKNLLAVVQSMARQTARQSASVPDFEERFGARIQALARAHDLLVKQDWRGVPLLELVEAQVEPFADVDVRVDAEGPSLTLTPSAAQHLALALHELANNAAKYGAFSNSDGSVAIRWSIDPAESVPRQIRVTWQEIGGPPVTPPKRRGFGVFVIEKMAAAGLNGTAALSFESAGVRWTVDFSADLVV